MELRAILVERRDRVAVVRLHRPHRHNAWTGRMHAEYRWVMRELDADRAVRAVVVTGTPPAFCVGGDSEALAGHAERGGYDPGTPDQLALPGYGVQPEFDQDMAWHFGLRVPVVAAVNGACAGVGLALAAFCDLRFVSATAKLTTAAPRLGLPAEYGLSWVLPRLVGVTRAADLLLSGRVVTGADTADWGLWNGVLPDGESALQAALDYADGLATTAAPSSLAVTKRQLYRDLVSTDVGRSVAEANRLLDEMTGGPDFREGVAALRAKRAPRF
jgi:enoyl-CoA hydratase/carnithine racemase